LNRLGLVAAKDLQHLEKMILQLHAKIDLLAEEQRKIQAQLSKK